MVFIKLSKNSQNTCTGFFNGTPAQVFSGECCISFKNTYFVQQERATVSETCEQMLWEGFEFKLTRFYLTKN